LWKQIPLDNLSSTSRCLYFKRLSTITHYCDRDA
jgi:hypothetical protein